jgi:MFS transporter, ACS family, allantoate permease
MFPYQWTFIFFGIFTVFFGISLWWLLPDSPLTATWLTERERIIAVERLKDNRTSVKNTHHKKAQIKEALCGIKVWMLVSAVFCDNLTNSLQSNFIGLILKILLIPPIKLFSSLYPPGIIMAATMLIVSFFLCIFKMGRR